MKVILAQPRGFCAGVVRAIEIVERALQKYGPPVYVRHEIVHNKHVVESLKAKGAVFVEELSEVPPNAVTVFSRAWRGQERRAGGRDARPAGAQCHLSARDQGAQPGQALCRPGPQADPDRPCRPPRGGRHHGADPGAGDAGAEREGSRRARHLARHPGRLCDADDALGRRHQGDHPGAAAQVLRHHRARDARHLLRDAEPPVGGARPLQAGRRHPGGRREEFVQFQSAARDRHRGRHPELPDRGRQRARSPNGSRMPKWSA